MTLSFNPVLKSAAHPADPKRTLDILDTPQMIADRYGVRHVEFQHSHLPSTDDEYFKQLRRRLHKANSSINQINVEFGPLNVSSPDKALRDQTIALTKQWIDHAASLECRRVMVNQGTLAPEVRQTAIETLRTMNEYGTKRKVFVTMENRGRGPSWDVVLEVIKASGIHANPDTGNFPNEEERARGLPLMYPLSCGSSHVHYAPERYSLANAIGISKRVGYKGLYSIEAVRANGPDPYVAVQTILAELLKDI